MALGDWFRSLGHAVGSLFTSAVDSETGIFDAYFSIKDDVEAAVRTLEDFKHFDFNPAWKNRVINVPRAIDGINDVADIIVHGFKDKFIELRDVVREIVSLIGEQRGPPEEGAGGLANVQSKLATVKLVTIRLKAAMHNVLELEQMLSDMKQRVETLEDLFLPQGSTKKTVDEHYRKRQRS